MCKIPIRIGSYLFFYKKGPFTGVFSPHVKRITMAEEIKSLDLDINKFELSRLLEVGADIFIYYDNSVVLGIMCGLRGSCYVRGAAIKINQNKNSVYWFWILTRPEARGRGIYKNLRESFFNYYSNVDRICALVHPKNSIMIKNMKKQGFRIKHKIFYFRFADKGIALYLSNRPNQITIRINLSKINHSFIV